MLVSMELGLRRLEMGFGEVASGWLILEAFSRSMRSSDFASGDFA